MKPLNTTGQYGPYVIYIQGDPEAVLWIHVIFWMKESNPYLSPWQHWQTPWPKLDLPQSLDLPDPALLRDLLLICRSYIEAGHYQGMPLYRYFEKMLGQPDAQ